MNIYETIVVKGQTYAIEEKSPAEADKYLKTQKSLLLEFFKRSNVLSHGDRPFTGLDSSLSTSLLTALLHKGGDSTLLFSEAKQTLVHIDHDELLAWKHKFLEGEVHA